MIKVINLKKSINGQEILKGINLDIPTAQTTAIIGRSGGGKSILLKHLVGLMKPDSGEIYVDGVEITHLKKKKLNNIKRRFGLLFQGAALFDSLTIFENVAFPLRELTNLNKTVIAERVSDALKGVGLSDIDYNKFPDEISGGMRKRVGLARAMITNPEYMFFDEPTTGLDPITESAIHNLIKKCMTMIRYSRLECKEVQCTEVLISHNIKEVLKLANIVALLHDGVIVEYTTPEKLVKSSNPIVKQFLSGGL